MCIPKKYYHIKVKLFSIDLKGTLIYYMHIKKQSLPHDFKCDAKMVAEVKVFQHVYEIVLVVFIFSPQCI